MLKHCLDGDRRFGVALIKTGKEVGASPEPFEIGTVARIEKVSAEDKGSIPIFTRGESRFRLLSLDRSKPYLTGELELIGDDLDAAAGPAADLARNAADDYIRLLLTVQGEWHRVMELPADPLKLSYFLGTVLLGLDGSVRQKMLEADLVSNRLQLAAQAASEAGAELRKTIMRAGPGNDRTVFGIN